MGFLTHGTGLVTHEAPRMTATGSPPYPATHARRALEAGMVISIETHVADPALGFIKLEDTVLVTAGATSRSAITDEVESRWRLRSPAADG